MLSFRLLSVQESLVSPTIGVLELGTLTVPPKVAPRKWMFDTSISLVSPWNDWRLSHSPQSHPEVGTTWGRGWHWVMSRHCLSISCARHQGGETRQRQESWGDDTVLVQCIYPLVPATWGLEVVTAERKGCSTAGLGHLPSPSKWHGLPFYHTLLRWSFLWYYQP